MLYIYINKNKRKVDNFFLSTQPPAYVRTRVCMYIRACVAAEQNNLQSLSDHKKDPQLKKIYGDKTVFDLI